MQGVSVWFFLGACVALGWSQFLNHRPFPTYSLENMPDTEFSCRDKILGGYYADAETQCQMFHICVKVAGVGIQDFRFLCPNGTAFDQDHQICAEWEDVDCDATTLYYSSDNFDLYRIGSGFESKAVKYGEEEETFALQRAETGDARLNREHQAQRVNQQKQELNLRRNRPHNQNNQNDRDIFKGSSSSNFFNNRNGGKENDEDYDDSVNINQNRDDTQKRKLVRKQQRRPSEQNDYRRPQNNEPNDNRRSQNNEQNDHRKTQNNESSDYRKVQNNEPNDHRKVQNNEANDQYNKRVLNENRRPNQQQQQQNNDSPKPTTSRPINRPSGFTNNFFGSSYVPTTSRPASTTLNADQYTTAINNHRSRNGQRPRPNSEKPYNNADNFRQNSQSTPSFTVSTPAPFKQTQYNNPPSRQTTKYDDGQYRPTTEGLPKGETENYPANFPQIQQKSNNYPSTPFKKQTDYSTPAPTTRIQPTQYKPNNKHTEHYSTPTTITKNPQNFNTQYDVQKVKSTFKQTDNYATNKKPTTPFKQTDNYPSTQPSKPSNYPSTFAPRTNAAYSQITQQTTQYKQNPLSSTPKSTPFTQYTPTVPKISSTTPVSRSNRYDETQYDDGSYNDKYDRRDDEFLKGAHSQNIASSRNELSKSTKNVVSPSTQKPYNESPRPFSVTPNTYKPTSQQQKVEYQTPKPKKVKDASYDYAYYDTNVGSDPEYEIDTEIKKSTTKN